jgi:hypothetical protein
MTTTGRSGRGWAYTGAILGGLVSVAANVAHSFIPPHGAPAGWHPEPGAVVGAIVWPVFLFIAVEILARVAWPSGHTWRLIRWGGLLPVALVAAFVSYRHLSGLLAHYGEEPLVQHLGPLAVDGLMVMATGALIATGTHHPRTTATAETRVVSTDTSRSTSTHHDDQAVTAPTVEEPAPVPAHLLPSARFAATNHEHTTGRPITPEELSARIGITPAVAAQVLTHLGASTPTPARINGTAITTGGAR